MPQKSKKKKLTYYDRCVRVVFEDLKEKLEHIIEIQRRIANGDSRGRCNTNSKKQILAVKKKESIVA